MSAISPGLRRLLLAAALLPLSAQAVPEGPEFPSPEFEQRELENFAKGTESLQEQLNPVFQQRVLEQALANEQSYLARNGADPSWSLSLGLGLDVMPLCASWGGPCLGDPFRYPEVDGPDGKTFYEQEAEVIPIVFYDQGCARISGRVWAPRNGRNGLPGIVIEPGALEASETLQWFVAQALVRAGYVVMTFDPRGQGRSDRLSPGGEPGGGEAVNEVFWLGLVDAIDFFHSNAARPYPHEAECAGTYPTVTTPFNPLASRLDPQRLGLAGHSAGAIGSSIVQGYGAPGADPWPGLIDAQNPVDVIVAWDQLWPTSGFPRRDHLDLVRPAAAAKFPKVVPRVPAMGQTSNYFVPIPNLTPPDPESHKDAYEDWRKAGLPVFQFTLRGTTHLDWSPGPLLPSTSWCATVDGDRCSGGWAQPMIVHYTLAWFDRWLKQPGEPGYADADARLLDDTAWLDRFSFSFRSARDFTGRDGALHHCEDIRAGCGDAVAGSTAENRSSAESASRSGGGSLDGSTLVLLLGALLLRRRREGEWK